MIREIINIILQISQPMGTMTTVPPGAMAMCKE